MELWVSRQCILLFSAFYSQLICFMITIETYSLVCHIYFIANKDVFFSFSSPCTIRLDTYKASTHLVDVHLQYPLEDFKENQDDFMKQLNDELSPWVVKLESSRLDGTPSRYCKLFMHKSHPHLSLSDISKLESSEALAYTCIDSVIYHWCKTCTPIFSQHR